MIAGKNNSAPEDARPLPVLDGSLVELATASIEAMKHGEAISRDGIKAIVELAEYGVAAKAVIEKSVMVPTPADIAALRGRLSAAVLASGGNKLAIDSKWMLDQLANALRHSERLRFVADQALAGYGRAFRDLPDETRGALAMMARDSAGGFESALHRDHIAGIVAFLTAIWPGDDPANPMIFEPTASNDH